MTYEEALNFNQKWTSEQAKNDLERYLLRDEKPAYKAVALGMQALEKQIPQKTNNKGVGICLTCPCCTNSIIAKGLPYCAFCGQALDWN